MSSLAQQKIPSWQASEAKPTPARLTLLKAIADGDQKAIHLELVKCARDPWYWLLNWVLTENAHSTSLSPFERFPDKAHLYYITRLWQVERLLIVPKSRQVMMTWLMVALYLHDAMFNSSRLTFVQSKKEEDADTALERAFTIYRYLPLFMRNWQPLTGGKKTFCHMRFSRNRSHLFAIPEGPDHARGETPTGFLSDETVFQDNVEKTLSGVMPGLGSKGRLTMISSVGPSVFQMLTFDSFKVG